MIPDLLPSQWAEENRILKGTTPKPGKWKNSVTPYLIKPLNHLSPNDPCQRVVCKFSSQRGKTEIILNFVGFVADCDPGPMLVIQPNVEPMAEAFSKERIAPMFRDTPSLKKKLGSIGSRISSNTILHKSLPGMTLDIVGANSTASLSSRPIQYIAADELGRWVDTKEGDALLLARKRLQVYRNMGMSKELLVSSPSFPGVNIDFEYQSCQQRWEEHVQCPACKEYQHPSRKRFLFENDDPTTVRYVCNHCGVIHGLKQELKIKKTAKWVCVAGEEIAEPVSVGFSANQFMSPFANWRDSWAEWFSAKGDPLKEQVIINTVFNEAYEGIGEKLETNTLVARTENWDLVPNRVKVLTCGIDVQVDRVELEVVGWGAGEESWSIAYEVIPGDPTEPDLYEEIGKFLSKDFKREDGMDMRIVATCIDSGHWSQHIYEWIRTMRKRSIIPIKGASRFSADPIAGNRQDRAKRTSRRIVHGRPPEMLGVGQIKLIIFKRLTLAPGARGYCHFPTGRGAGYFDGLTGERLVRSNRPFGPPQYAFEKITDSVEPLDCRVYAYGALLLSGLSLDGTVSGTRKETPATTAKKMPPRAQNHDPVPRRFSPDTSRRVR